MVLSGQMRNYCPVRAGTRTSDGQGGWTVAWATSYSEWFKATPLSMSRSLDERGIKYRLACQFECRYRTDLTAANQITYNGDNFTIDSVLPDDKLNFLKILAYA